MIERPTHRAVTTQQWRPMKSLDDYYKEMDGSKLEWISLPHTHFTMIKRGKCPIDMTSDQVTERVIGTFGGRFSRWGEAVNQHGKPIITFEYIAHTD
ncbi:MULTISPECIES: hypothetical protein [Aeromonas]|nr:MULTISPECIES: hypothetical protein [Aeromonas]MBO0505291.1 hypothetical protein [Aeromonas veronii]MCY9814437.1 hypothetical protein [Aeromonas caviae]WEA31671.1 hypothetical protein PWO56_07655 [Aeromonas hydrophila]WEA32187.1 hypothetical protein PWO56_10365 [Aeromonas hydrophila]